MPLRVAAIDFLNPAPLMWDFNRPPLASSLALRYALHRTSPSQCAAQLLAGEADLGLIPIAALTPALAVVPGCTIASPGPVRSIQLVVKAPHTLASVRSVAADSASRSSLAYTQLLFRHFLHTDPSFHSSPAELAAMLREHDAALLIGDPALVALEQRPALEAQLGPLTWYDIASEWNARTGLPWVAAVWAVRPQALAGPRATDELIADLNLSREHGQANTEALVAEWCGRLPLAPATIRTYLTRNIHYTLDEPHIAAIHLFRTLAAEANILPPLGLLHLLDR